MVSDIIMPPLGLLIGGVNFTELKVVMKAAAEHILLLPGIMATFCRPVLIFWL